MSLDALLASQLFELGKEDENVDRVHLLQTSASLLVTLQNPLNVSLLVEHLLHAHALWNCPAPLQFYSDVLGVFFSASKHVLDNEHARKSASSDLSNYQSCSVDTWINAVIAGSSRCFSPRRRALAFSGLLLAINNRSTISTVSHTFHPRLSGLFVQAINQHIETQGRDGEANHYISIPLYHAFPLLHVRDQQSLPYDKLLLLLLDQMLCSPDCLDNASFLLGIEVNLSGIASSRIDWSSTSPSFQKLQHTTGGPLVLSLGPFSRLIAYAVEHSCDPVLVGIALSRLEQFAIRLNNLWRQTTLSSISGTMESARLTDPTKDITMALLWKLFRNVFFAVTLVLEGVLGRLFQDRRQINLKVHVEHACSVLRVLRAIEFIQARHGSTLIEQYTFVHTASIDILLNHKQSIIPFLRSILPTSTNILELHPVDQAEELFYLNTVEHFVESLDSEATQILAIEPAIKYLDCMDIPIDMQVNFEAALSVMLVVFAAPQNAHLATQQMPMFLDQFLAAFPTRLSVRQLRIGLKNLVHLLGSSTYEFRTPEADLLAATLIEVLRHRAISASLRPLTNMTKQFSPHGVKTNMDTLLSEKAVLTMAIIDCLPFVDLRLLEECLLFLPELINSLADRKMQQECTKHLWETMTSNLMDADRSQLCTAWWTTNGGREALLGQNYNNAVTRF